MLTKKQTLAVKLLYEDKMTDAQIAKKLGISRKTLSAWKKKPDFNQALTGKGTAELNSLTVKAVQTLADLLTAKSDSTRLKAAQTILRANGLLETKQELELLQAKTAKAKAEARSAEAAAVLAQANADDVRQSEAILGNSIAGLSTNDLEKLAQLDGDKR